MGFSEVREAIDAVGRLGMVVVVDDEDRENEGDLVMAAEAATPENIAFFLAHTSGVICVPVESERADGRWPPPRPSFIIRMLLKLLWTLEEWGESENNGEAPNAT